MEIYIPMQQLIKRLQTASSGWMGSVVCHCRGCRAQLLDTDISNIIKKHWLGTCSLHLPDCGLLSLA
uniref:Uncharacterized protein n=1 Tax=Anguilla anguilla TaxID=7936 RepID=A0A0E9Q6D4_ANGAN